MTRPLIALLVLIVLIGRLVFSDRGRPPAPLGSHTEQVLPDLGAVGRAVPSVEWPVTGGDPGGTRHSRLDDINRATVARLTLAWVWHAGEAPRQDGTGTWITPDRFQATPVMLGDTLFLSTPFHRVVALDANTGREFWAHDPGTSRWPMLENPNGFVHRGVAVWSGPAGRRVFLNTRWRLIALDAATGIPVERFGERGEVDLTRGLRWPVDRLQVNNTSPPIVLGNLVIVGSSVSDRIIYPRDPPGDVQAFDAESGRRVWTWSPVPSPGEAGSETWEGPGADSAGHANVWSAITADTARGLLFLPVSAASNDWYGGARPGGNLYSESLVCLDARTGRMVWYFQLVHHGLWDYDPAAAPTLVTVRRDVGDLDAVALAGKTGFLYVFERATGVPLWPIEERAVLPSDVPGEQASPTQPVVTRPLAFAKQGFSEADVVDFTPELRHRALGLLRRYRTGPLFTPPSLQGTVVMPGWLGGAGWGATAYDPESRTLYIKASNRPALARLVEPPAGGDARRARYILDPDRPPEAPLYVPFPRRPAPLGWLEREPPMIPINQPPYGTLTAIDLDRGEQRWQVTLGDTPAVRYHPRLRHLQLPPLGVVGPPGGTVTAGGLIFITGGGHVLYALDTRDGSVRWQWDLGRAGWAVPMTYRTRHGRQFVVIATGRGEDSRLMAFTLADQ